MTTEESRSILSRQERRLARPALGKALHSEEGVGGSRPRVAGADGGATKGRDLTTQQALERREVCSKEWVPVRIRGTDPHAVEKEEENSGSSHRLRRLLTSCAPIPWIRITLFREDRPRATSIRERGIPRIFARSRRSSLLAAPSTGGAASLTFTASPWVPTISERLALG
jgi:hypothetical protein